MAYASHTTNLYHLWQTGNIGCILHCNQLVEFLSRTVPMKSFSLCQPLGLVRVNHCLTLSQSNRVDWANVVEQKNSHKINCFSALPFHSTINLKGFIGRGLKVSCDMMSRFFVYSISNKFGQSIDYQGIGISFYKFLVLLIKEFRNRFRGKFEDCFNGVWEKSHRLEKL